MIDHMCLLVVNLEESKFYYERLFNAKSKKHPTQNNVYMIENKELHFFIKQVNFPKDFIEQQHLSVKIDSVAHGKQILLNNNINKFEMGEFTDFSFSNYKWIEWKDPNGIRLEFVELI